MNENENENQVTAENQAAAAATGNAAETNAEQTANTTGNAEITATYDPLVLAKEVTFNFRKVKDAETGVETKRESVTGKVCVPSVEGLVAILKAGGKELDLLLAAAESVVVDYARQQVSDDTKVTSETFSALVIDWKTIANLPDADRRGRGIPKETWEEFIASYVEVMPALLDKSVDVVKRQASILAQKFQPLRMHEKKNEFLPKFLENLALYANTAPDAEQYAACLEFLVKKAEQYMTADNSTDLEANLGF